MTATLEIPQRIGRFRIHSMLGRGAMGVVYKGHDEHIDRLVAIKLIRTDLLDSEERENYFQRFRNEAKIAGRCVHANIVGLYDFSFHESNPYLVMEYVDGMGLQQALPRGTQWREEEVLPIGLQVLDALQYAHERGIVHRDVKPPNILLTTESKLKITDFGISRLTSTEQTMTPLLIGTPSYMSPEQCMGASLDGRSDLFSLGCVLYELLAGRRPFTGANYTDTILGIINRPHPPLQDFRDDLTPALIDVIDRALAKNPADRFPDASAFSLALEQISGSPFRVPAIPRNLSDIVVASQTRDTMDPSGAVGHVAPLVGDEADTVLAPRRAEPDRAEAATARPAEADAGEPTQDRRLSGYETANDGVEASEVTSVRTIVTTVPLRDEADAVESAPADEMERAVVDEDDDATRIMPSPASPLAPPFVADPMAVASVENDEGAIADRSSPEVPDRSYVSVEEEREETREGRSDEGGEQEPLMTPPMDPAPTAYAGEQETIREMSSPDLAAVDAIQAIPDQATPNGDARVVFGDAFAGATTDDHALEVDWGAWQSWTAICLTRVIGPIGPILVARHGNDEQPDRLVDHCADFIQHDDERADFLRFVGERPVPAALARKGQP
ncbi:hypothetical protein AA101099_0085 [Neoasaia chiangmaiensis NBRC 101099]|uniref:non-specific serine/threonine protein kinase n=1 Tax=Neoasaia chiangmaiensis TaxID=320497 RepID=A0A1U9KLU4_9PROT|nr:serine/threonine-protein kinase [Neoasaia chiangmaiensis]AQS86745.1 hypothetical protein A0U93_00890 [Neoasaia chiangmaiensis]GBR35594.1 hypothetical protein AA101099_0085 [Neoasaia chiangmaiensis NBRC 101099]GEN16404.1 hypothetical protein NCH01_28350 [Neoasaia chiangmaiensis]